MKQFGEELKQAMVRAFLDARERVDTRCKYCGGWNIVRFGHFRGVQRWWCKECKRKFVDNQALPKMKTPIVQVALALSEFYEGNSLISITRNLGQTYGYSPTDAAVYYWIVKFTKIALEATKDYKPQVGDVFIADETVLRIGGQNLWFWDLLCERTRFLLASHISLTRTTRDARILVERAAERAGKIPKVIITDKLQAYLDGIELAFGADTKHITAKGLTGKKNIIERFHGTLKSRTKVMRGLKHRETAKLFTDGWLVHYNFFRPHEALDDFTPAHKAGIRFPYRNWLDIVKKGGNNE